MYSIIGADQKEYGPVTPEQIVQWISEGRINGKTLAKVEGGAWKPVATFSELASHLPAASPMPPAGSGPPELPAPGSGRVAALAVVKGPAIGLIVTAVLGFGFTVLGMMSQPKGFDPFGGFFPLEPDVERIMRAVQGPVMTISNLLGLIVSGIVLYGGLRMRNLQSYGLSIAASIMAILPCACPACCAGIPLGIWSLVVLSRSEVSSHFR